MMNAFARWVGLTVLVLAALSLGVWLSSPPTIYAPPTEVKTHIAIRDGQRVLWITRFDINKVKICDAGGDNGIFRVRYKRKHPLGLGWEEARPTYNLHTVNGVPVRGANRVGADVGERIVIDAGRWAQFPAHYERFTHFSIEVPCQLANGRWIWAEWGPAKINRGDLQ